MTTTAMETDLREELLGMLGRGDFDAVVSLGRARYAVLRTLISLTYDMSDVRSWRAVDAIGRITREMPADRVRNLIQRLLWMLREESGSNAWTAGQIIGEIVAQNPRPFEDIAPIVVSFNDEPLFRVGALWSLCRIGAVRPDLVREFSDAAVEHLGDSKPLVRALAARALRVLGEREERLLALHEDMAVVDLYKDGEFVRVTVAEAAKGLV